jgi:hypothetical protein
MIRWHIDIEIGQADERLAGLCDALTMMRDHLVDNEIGHTWTEERDHVTPGQRNPFGS